LIDSSAKTCLILWDHTWIADTLTPYKLLRSASVEEHLSSSLGR
jgi:hypothetical protein